MLTPSDFVHLDFTNELTQAGIAYACRSLVLTSHPQEAATCERIQQIVTEIAVELAFRRYLVAHRIPHNSQKAKPFTEPDRQNVYLGGRMCEIKSHLITHRDTISRIRKDGNYLLQAPVQVPIDLFESDHVTDKDLIIFAFATGLVTSTKDELERADSANQPSYCIHLLPKIWAQPKQWRSLGGLVINATTSEPVTIEMAGSGETREFLHERLQLLPQRKTYSQAEFYSLYLLHNTQIPGAQVRIYSPITDQTHNITSNEWGNIWIYGMDITLAGFMTRGEFRRQARPEPIRRQVFKPPTSRSGYMVLPISKLRSLKDLFKSTKDWYRGT